MLHSGARSTSQHERPDPRVHLVSPPSPKKSGFVRRQDQPIFTAASRGSWLLGDNEWWTHTWWGARHGRGEALLEAPSTVTELKQTAYASEPVPELKQQPADTFSSSRDPPNAVPVFASAAAERTHAEPSADTPLADVPPSLPPPDANDRAAALAEEVGYGWEEKDAGEYAPSLTSTVAKGGMEDLRPRSALTTARALQEAAWGKQAPHDEIMPAEPAFFAETKRSDSLNDPNVADMHERTARLYYVDGELGPLASAGGARVLKSYRRSTASHRTYRYSNGSPAPLPTTEQRADAKAEYQGRNPTNDLGCLIASEEHELWRQVGAAWPTLSEQRQRQQFDMMSAGEYYDGGWYSYQEHVYAPPMNDEIPIGLISADVTVAEVMESESPPRRLGPSLGLPPKRLPQEETPANGSEVGEGSVSADGTAPYAATGHYPTRTVMTERERAAEIHRLNTARRNRMAWAASSLTTNPAGLSEKERRRARERLWAPVRKPTTAQQRARVYF